MKNITYSLFLMMFGFFVQGQTVVTGTVTDATSNQPIPGANILVVGQTVGTSTDFDGNFRLEVNQAPPFQITISILGFQP